MDTDPIIDGQAVNYIIMALGICEQNNLLEKNWKIKLNEIEYEFFPEHILDFGDRVRYVKDIFIGKKISHVISQIMLTVIHSNNRMMIVDYLTLILLNKRMSMEMNEMKKRFDDLNDKFSILIDVLQINSK